MPDRYASLKQGLVGCWIPSVSGSGLLLPDLSGRNNSGSLVGMDASDWVSSQYGRALDFDGVNDYVSCPQVPFTGTGNFSISLWVLQATIRASDHAIKFGTATLNNAVGIFNSSGNNLAIGLHANNASEASLTGNLATNVFYHVVGTCTPTRREIWLNGVLQGTSTTTVNYDITSTFCNIGAAQSTLVPWNGRLDDIRVYSRVLTEPEIRLLASEPGIGFKPAKKLSRFSQRFTYNPPKARNYSVIRVKETDYATLRQGLVGAWCPSLPNGGSGSTLPDQSGYNNHGVLTNMGPEDWVSSQYGRALDFDGTDDYVGVANKIPATGEFTLSAFVKTSQASEGNIFSNNNSQAGRFDFKATSLSGGVYVPLLFINGSPSVVMYATTPVNDGKFHHVSVTRNAANLFAIYVDGRQENSTTNSVSIDTSTNYRIAARPADSTQNLTGQLDDVRLYSRALTESEIKLLASKRGIGLRQESHRNTFYQFPSGARRKRILTGMP